MESGTRSAIIRVTSISQLHKRRRYEISKYICTGVHDMLPVLYGYALHFNSLEDNYVHYILTVLWRRALYLNSFVEVCIISQQVCGGVHYILIIV